MQPDTQEGGMQRSVSLGQEPRDDARQHIAAAGRGHARVADIEATDAPRGVENMGGMSLQHNDGVRGLCKVADIRQVDALHEAHGLAGMRCENASVAERLPVPFGMPGQDVYGIGIDDEGSVGPTVSREHVVDLPDGLLFSAQTGPQSDGIIGREELGEEVFFGS